MYCTSAITITGQTPGEVLDAAPFCPFALSESIIRLLSSPLYLSSSLVILYSNLAPYSCILTASASVS